VPTCDPAPMMPMTATSVITMEMLATTLTNVLVFSRASMSSIRVMVYAAIMTLRAGIIDFFQGRHLSVPFRSREYSSTACVEI
jgi:hypothetical protein